MTALAVALVVCLLVGVLVDRALLGDPGLGPIERFGRGLALGFGVVGALSMALDVAGVGVSAVSLGVAVLVVVGLLARPAATVPARVAPHADEDRRRLLGLPANVQAMHAALWLLALSGVAMAVWSGWVRPTFQFDAVTRWMFKAKALHYEGTLLGPISHDPYYGLTHQRYPPLVSHVANLPALVSGTYDDRIGSAIFPWFAVALVAVVYGAVRRRCGALSGAFAAAWIGTLPLLAYKFTSPAGAGAASAMADVPLGMFVAAASLAAIDAVDGRRARGHLEAALLVGFAALTKNEGLPFVAGIGLAFLVAAPRARLRRALGVAGVGGAVYLALWGLLSTGLPVTDEHYLGRLHGDAVTSGLGRLGIIFPDLGAELADFRSWNLTWLAVIALLLLGGRRILRPAPRLLAVVLAVQVGAYVFAYVVTSWTSPAAEIIHEGEDPLPLLIKLTLGRLLMHIAPVAIVLGLLVSPLTAGREQPRSC